VWRFDDGGAMQHMISSPCVADGRLYIGEGMHANLVCNLYCLDAATGEKLWHFRTGGHIESTPCVGGGRVFFGAGDDGIYCLDAVTGKQCWQFTRGGHVDTGPALAGDHLYAGSGVSRLHKTSKVFCVDARRGTLVWQTPTDLPAWGSPVVGRDQVYFGLGNGRLLESARPPERPAGALLCVDAADGRPVWQYAVSDAVFGRAALAGEHVFFGARDGFCYCLDRAGRLEWKTDLGSPVLTRPAVSGVSLYVVPSGGAVCCLDAATGWRAWTFDVAAHSQTRPRLASSPIVVPDPTGAGHPWLYFGAELQNSVSSAAMVYALRD
jgi:outer membrane protein assembly factor BamB